jgi:hypothetical protein
MSEISGSDLPPHVEQYLKKHEVDADRLPENVLQALAGLSTREVEFLAFIGNELTTGGVDIATVARIH